jgi:hypothetical protein
VIKAHDILRTASLSNVINLLQISNAVSNLFSVANGQSSKKVSDRSGNSIRFDPTFSEIPWSCACLSEGMENVMKKTSIVLEIRLVLGSQNEFGENRYI